MDLVARCKDKLAYFRMKELKDVLTQLGLSKQGRKQDLVDRILSNLSDDRGSCAKKNSVWKDDVAKLVDDTYRKMQVPGRIDFQSKSQCTSESNVKLKEETEETCQTEKIRCLCGSSLSNETTIKCEDPRCGVWQHTGCVIIPEIPNEDASLVLPETFYCELCRLTRADPFWVTMAHPLYPVKLLITNVLTDGSNPVQKIERTFQLTRADKDLLSKQEYDVQAWCMLLNDKVPFRMQWPQCADLQVNGVPVRTINRPGPQLLGANGRDDGPVITPWTRDGINKISLTGGDARVFCLGVRIVKRRSVQHILNLIPKESEGEQFEVALARVRRCVGGGTATENADSDSDLEVIADFIPVNLRCPMSGSRIKVAGRFKPCLHMGCFDLEVFVEMNMRSRKWQCPICLKNYCLDNIIIDPYFNLITSKLCSYGEDVNEIEVKPDGSWRAKAESDRRGPGDVWLWHAPDGSLCVSMDVESKPKSDILKQQIKQEGGSDGHGGLKLGMKKNSNGVWEINKQEGVQTFSSGNKLHEDFYQRQDIIAMSSGDTGTGKDGEDPSVNQDGGGNLDYSTNNGIEPESISLNIDPAYGYTGRNPPAPLGDTEVIVLTDSDEENEPVNSSGPGYTSHQPGGGGVSHSVPTNEIPNSYPEIPSLNTGGSSCPDFFSEMMHLWPLFPPGGSDGPGFPLLGSCGDVANTLVDMQPGSINCTSSMNGYILAADTAIGSAPLVPESSSQHICGNITDGLVDNDTLGFGGNDPSLQLFLPTTPTDASMQSELRNQPDISNGIHTEDWISLRLGSSSGGGTGESASANGSNAGQQLKSKEGALDSLAEASLLLGINDNGSSKTSRERSDSPCTFPRQRRSVRPRLQFHRN